MKTNHKVLNFKNYNNLVLIFVCNFEQIQLLLLKASRSEVDKRHETLHSILINTVT